MAEVNDIKNKVSDIVKTNVIDAKDIANKSETGRCYTDHNDNHIEMVTNQTLDTTEAISDAIKNGYFQKYENGSDAIMFNRDVNYKLLAGAAMSHDTGMSDHGFNLKDNDGIFEITEQNEKDRIDFDPVRSNHPLNSAINLLSRREDYKKLGYSDKDVDSMAVMCYSHSKSNSGITNLNNKSNWMKCYDRIDAVINAYNDKYPDKKISFDRNTLSTDEELGKLATSALALRVGDVSRSSFADDISQSGEVVHVCKDKIDVNAATWKDEIKDPDCVLIGDDNRMSNDFSRKCHVGEQNIVGNRNYYDVDNNTLVHEIAINEGEFAPNCTAMSIRDHIGEFASAGVGDYTIKLNFNGKKYDRSAYDSVLKSYMNEINSGRENGKIHLKYV